MATRWSTLPKRGCAAAWRAVDGARWKSLKPNENRPRRRRRKPTDARLIGAELYLLPVATRMPLKFGSETLRAVTCARVRVTVAGRDGRTADGWGETPLSVEWAWPSASSHSARRQAMIDFCGRLTAAFAQFDAWGHALEIGAEFQRDVLPALIAEFNAGRAADEQLPLLAALVCCSPFDLALHDAYGRLHGVPIYETYDRRYLSRDLADLFQPNGSATSTSAGKYPDEFLAAAAPTRLRRLAPGRRARSARRPTTSPATSPTTAIPCCSATGSTATA